MLYLSAQMYVMMEEPQISGNQEPAPFQTEPLPKAEAPVWMVLGAQFGLLIFGAGISAVLYLMVCSVFGWDASLSLRADSPPLERWQVRFQLGLGHFFAFLVSGALTVWVFYRGITQRQGQWADYLRSGRRPGLISVALAVLLMAVSLPLVLFALQLNQQIPLPEIFKLAEAQATEALKGLLQMDNVWELGANLLIVAVLPAIGEELVFRGVVQQQLMRAVRSPWLAILMASAIFSAAHFQMEGFLPRMLLGVLLGWLYWRTRNFWVPVAGHFFNNAIQVLVQYLYAKEVSSVDLEKDIHVPWQLALLSTFMVVIVMRMIPRASVQGG
jgi:Predicted metal-dependent membrane protease